MNRVVVSLIASLACAFSAFAGKAAVAPAASTDMRSADILPFPDDSTGFILLTTLAQVRYQTSQLELKLGSAKAKFKDADDRSATYLIWKRAMLSAIAIRQTEGDTELMLSTLAALYRQGVTLGVETCRENAQDTVERALEMYPDSMLVNWQAAYLYEQEPENLPKAEAALMKLRQLLATDMNYEVERRLAVIYVSGKDKDKALVQVDRCLAMRPDDARMLDLKGKLSTAAVK